MIASDYMILTVMGVAVVIAAWSTHAWAEIYLPGAGWLGFGPTIGDIVGADHFPVAVSRLPEAVPPVSGSFRGAAKSTLDVGVWVSRC